MSRHCCRLFAISRALPHRWAASLTPGMIAAGRAGLRLAPLAVPMLLAGCTSLPWSQDAASGADAGQPPLKVPAPAQDPGPVVHEVAKKPAPPSAESLGKAAAVTLPSSFLPPPRASEYQVWRCTPAQDLLMAFSEGDAEASHDWLRLWSRRHAYTLERVVSASGERYQANAGVSSAEQASGDVKALPGEEGLEVWFKGSEAMLQNARGNLECVQDDRRVIHPTTQKPLLVAQGNEPGWQVSLDSEHNLLTLTAMQGLLDSPHEAQASERSAETEAGARSSGVQVVKLPYRVAREANDSRVLKAQLPADGKQGEPLQLVVAPGACFDSMQGAPYPLTATLTIAGQELKGCGEAFRYQSAVE